LKLSTDRLFVEKVVDMVELYHNPPDKAVVLCVDHCGPAAVASINVQVLEAGIRTWIESRNRNPRPFTWTKTAEEILESLARYIAGFRRGGTGAGPGEVVSSRVTRPMRRSMAPSARRARLPNSRAAAATFHAILSLSAHVCA
jgi:hypothetical protein